MIRALELLVFGVAAAGMHLAVLAQLDKPAGGSPATAGAPPSIEVAAADPALRALVETWRKPPEAAAAPPAPEAPAAGEAPVRPAAVAPPESAAPPVLPEAPRCEAALPRDDAQAPARRPRPRPEGLAPAVASPGAAGRAAPGQAAPLGGPSEITLRQSFAAAVRAAIAREQAYPPRARERGITGAPGLRVTVGRDGRLRGVAVTGPSGSALLDAAAVAAVRAVGRFPAAPPGLQDEEFMLDVRLIYELD
jgi:periplasmic protein TonB